MGTESRNRKVAACGIYCGGCNDYLADLNNDDELRKKVASDIKEETNTDVPWRKVGCRGCWGDIHNPWTASLECKIRQCVEKKGFATCASCAAFPCETFSRQFDKNSNPRKNIDRIKEVGLDIWLKEIESLNFTPAGEHKPGTVLELLELSWKPLWNPELEKKLKQFDFEVYDNPDTVGACTLVTCLEGWPIAMVSYDPRQGPERGIIGYNCVIPEHQNKGFGRRQILEVLRILRDRGFDKVAVSTGEEEFFVPAQRMYKACGFHQCARHDNNIEYEIVLK